MDYRYYTNGKTIVVATVKMGKKIIRGVAKCHPDDEFSEETGRRIAKMRCDEKINAIRMKRAARELVQATEDYANAAARLFRAQGAYDRILQNMGKER